MKKYLLFLILLAPLAQAQTTYLWDDFNDGDADGWVEMATGATYEVTDSLTYRMSYQGGSDEYALSYWGTLMPVPDYTMLTDFVGHGPTTHVGLDVRFDHATGYSYTVYADYGDDDFIISKYTPDYIELLVMPFDFVYDQPYTMKFYCSGDSLKAKVWETGTSEPDWMLLTADSDITAPGYVALECMRNPSGSFSCDFDNVLVAESIPSVFSQTTWGAIKTVF